MKRFYPFLLPGLLAVVFAACAPAVPVAKDTVVTMSYVGKTTDGNVFDSTAGRAPLTVVIGEGNIIPGLEKGLMGMRAGDKKTIDVAAADAYGPRRDNLVFDVPKSSFPPDLQLKAGLEVVSQTPQGPLPARIVEIDKDTVKVDFNHPLAGKDLIFDVQVLDVRKATPDEISGKVQPAPPQAKTPKSN